MSGQLPVGADETNVLLGPNGCGKTSVLRALALLQQLITHSASIDGVMSMEDLTRWQRRNEQRFELNLTIQGNTYHYTLVVEHDRDRRRMRIIKELLTHNDRPPSLTLQTAMPSFIMIIIPKDPDVASIGLVQVLAV